MKSLRSSVVSPNRQNSLPLLAITPLQHDYQRNTHIDEIGSSMAGMADCAGIMSVSVLVLIGMGMQCG